MNLFSNKKGGFDDALDTFAGFMILLLAVLVFLLMFVGGDKKQEVMFKEAMEHINSEQQLITFLESSSPSGIPMRNFLLDTDNVVNFAFFKRQALETFEPIYGRGRNIWSLVIRKSDGNEIVIGDEFGVRTTIAEADLPSKDGLLHIYLLKGKYNGPEGELELKKDAENSNLAKVHRFR